MQQKILSSKLNKYLAKYRTNPQQMYLKKIKIYNNLIGGALSDEQKREVEQAIKTTFNDANSKVVNITKKWETFMKEAGDKIAGLKQEIEKLKKEAQTNEVNMTILNGKIDELNAERENLTEEKKRIEKEINRLNSEAVKDQTKILELTKQLESVNSQLAEVNEQLKTKQEELNQLQADRNATIRELSELWKNELSSQMSTLQNSLKELEEMEINVGIE